MTTAVFYIGYSVLLMTFDMWFAVSFLLILTEILVIVLNSWRCPLTTVARRYAAEDSPNFDIYLPSIIARYNKEIFSLILIIILLTYIYNVTVAI
jgi:hypothetical protein